MGSPPGMLFLAPPSHLSALPTLPQHAVTHAAVGANLIRPTRNADKYALKPQYREIVCEDDWLVQPFADEWPVQTPDAPNTPVRDARAQQVKQHAAQQATQQVSVTMLCIWAIFFYQLFSLLEEIRRW